MEEDISVRAKEIEAKLKGGPSIDKKPKDLLRAIGMYTSMYLVLSILIIILYRKN
jgi:hypothetical protein